MPQEQDTDAKVKEPLTYEKQIERLINFHKLDISDKEKAKKILQRINYYRLSGYGIGLAKPDNRDEYKSGITLTHLYCLYKFDSELKNLLSFEIEQIEIQFRATLAYKLAIEYGALGYKEPKNFQENKEKILQKTLKCFENIVASKKDLPFVKHHKEKYGGDFPIWVAVELFTFGNLSSIYSIMKASDKKYISNLYGTKDYYFNSWIRLFVEVRNICAHYGRIYNMCFKIQPKMYKDCSFKKYINKRTKLFELLIVMKKILEKDQWNCFYNKLNSLLKSNNDYIDFSFINFPTNWEEILKNGDNIRTRGELQT